MNTKLNGLAAIAMMGFGALTMGCYAETGTYLVTDGTVAYNDPYYAGYGTSSPQLVAAGPDVWVVNGYPSVYYADNYYWTYSGNTWYRSSYWNGGWGVVNVNAMPVAIVNYRSGNYSNYGYNHPSHHVAAQPYIVRHPSRPSVHVGQSYGGQTHVGQTQVGHHSVPSNPGPSFHNGGATHVNASPSFHSAPSPSFHTSGSFHAGASPSFHSGGSSHSSHVSSGHSHHR